MKDAKGHGSNPRGAHTSGIEAATADDGTRHARPTGFPVGGWYALHPVTGETLKKPNAQYGDLPPRFATEDKAHAYAMKVTRK